ncbi:MAG: hypothetical protein CL868_08610 [Cytophagaceae bacterium]|nr:hypothetical protein [Cytophagaceae bacterium]
MKIHLKKKKLNSGKYSLYIEYYRGHTLDEKGKTKHLREFEYLKQYLIINPKNASEKKANEETQLRAEQILSIRRAEYAQGKYSIKDRSKEKLNFLSYYDKLKEERYESKGNYDNWDAAQNHLEKYCKNKQITFEDIDENFVLGFKKYLNKNAKTKSNTRNILGSRKLGSARVFQGLKYGAHFNAEILRWCMRAGITKHITFHSARHTHAVLLLEHGADIYTVSKILGHKEIRTTQIYAKIVDNKKKEAAYLIPKLEI